MASTNREGLAIASFDGLDTPGAATLVARVPDPTAGNIVEASQPIRVVQQNQDGEPNDTLATAAPASVPAAIGGTVGGGDGRDLYRIEEFESGTLRATVSAADPGASLRLALRDAAGNPLAEVDSVAGAARGEAPIPPGTAFVEIASAGGAVGYTLALEFLPDPPVIERIDPATSPRGSTVTLTGSGFDVRPERDKVRFGDVFAEVLEASAGTLRVVVPALALGGPVTVAKGGVVSDGVAFATGQSDNPLNAIPVEAMGPIEAVDDPFAGEQVAARELIVGFQPGVGPATVQALAAADGARIVGALADANEYFLEFDSAPDAQSLYAIAHELEASPDVVYASPLDIEQPQGFYVTTRDFTTTQEASAYQQIKAFEAWEAISDSGFFDAVGDFFGGNTLLVGVIDVGDNQNSVNAPQFPANRFARVDLGASCAADPSCIARASCPPRAVCPVSVSNAHGTSVAGVIGAANRGSFDKDLSTGILGGVLPGGEAATFYKVVLADTHFEQDQFNPQLEAIAWKGMGTIGARVVNFSGGSFLRDPAAPVSFAEMGAACPAPRSGAPANPFQAVCNATPAFGTNASQRALRETIVRQLRAERRASKIQYFTDRLNQVPGALVVVAAGNENGPTSDAFPAAMTLHGFSDRVVSVAAVGQGMVDERIGGNLQHFRDLDLASNSKADLGADARAPFSNFGHGTDLAAPGTAVLTVNDEARPPPGLATSSSLFPGTSAAAPLVAGSAALLLALDSTLSPSQLKTLLLDSATPIGGVTAPPARNFAGASISIGWGDWTTPRRLNLLSAVQRVLARRSAAAPSGSPTVPFTPGRKRYAWVVDSQTNRLVRAQFLEGFEGDRSAYRADTEDLAAHDCTDPAGLASSRSGDKLYIACRGSQSLLVWNVNRMRPVPTPDGASSLFDTIALPGSISANRVSMAVSPNGDFLFVPLAGQEFARIDIRSDTVLDIRRFKPAQELKGDLRAFAFDSRSRLLAVTSLPESFLDIRRGTLVRVDDGDLVTRPALRSPNAALQTVDVRQATVQQLDLDEPIGVSVQSQNGRDFVYVNYGGSNPEPCPFPVPDVFQPPDCSEPLISQSGDPGATVAASVHDGASLVQLGAIDDQVVGRQFLPLIPGAFLPVTPHGVSPLERYTGTRRAFDLAFDPNDPERGYALFDWGAGLALFDASPVIGGLGTRRPLSAAAGFEGQLLERSGFATWLTGLDGFVSGNRVVNDAFLYSQDVFPIAFDIDQQGELIVDAIAGTPGKLRVYFASALRAAAAQLFGDQTPATTLLESVEPVSTDLDIDPQHTGDSKLQLEGPKDVLETPQLSVLLSRSAASGDLQGLNGVVDVQLAVRDPEIRSIACRVLRCGAFTSPGQCDLEEVASDFSTLPSGPNAPGPLGIAYETHSGLSEPVCVFAGLPVDDLVLEVVGEKAGGVKVTTRQPFRYRGDPQ